MSQKVDEQCRIRGLNPNHVWWVEYRFTLIDTELTPKDGFNMIASALEQSGLHQAGVVFEYKDSGKECRHA